MILILCGLFGCGLWFLVFGFCFNYCWFLVVLGCGFVVIVAWVVVSGLLDCWIFRVWFLVCLFGLVCVIGFFVVC